MRIPYQAIVDKSLDASGLRAWLKPRHPALAYGVAALLPALAQAARLPLHPPTLIPFITFVPFMLLSASFGGLGPGLLTTVLCTLESVYFATEPTGSFRVADPRNWFGVSALAFTGVVASVLFERLRRARHAHMAAYSELAAIQSHAPVMLLVVDGQLRVRKANDLAVELSGLSAKDVLGFGPGTAIGCLHALADPQGCGHGPECTACTIRTAVLDTLRNGARHSGEEGWVSVSADGSERMRCLQVATVPMQLDEAGRTALICAQDITESKSAQAELRRQAELIDLSHDAIVTLDKNRAITGWNTGAQEMYGWTRGEALGSVLHRLLRTSAAVSVAKIDDILSLAGRWRGELEQECHDGTRLVVDSQQVLLRDSGGRPAGILEIDRDITKNKRAEAELHKAHRRTTAILESISDGFIALDRESRYVYVNQAAERILGVSRQELLGQNLWEVWPNTAETPFGEAQRRAVEQNIPVRVEALYGEPLNGWFEVRNYPSPEGLSQFFTEITARKEAEEEIRRLNAELEQRVRERTAQLEAANQELETFAYTVSHDLRAPLRGVEGWSQALVEDFGSQLDGEARHYLERVRTEAQRMAQLIDDLLQLSRLTNAPLDRGPVDLTELARSIAGNLRETHPSRNLEFAIQPGLTAHGDARLLEVALTNLMGNAVKFTGERAVARIEFGRTEQAGTPVLYIRDNGAGFDMAYAGSLFGAFQRLHKTSEFPGTGIGLATVQRVIRRHGGRIWAEAQVDRGASFYFTLE